MQRTVFSTPIISSLARLVSIILLKLTGWKVIGEAPANKKCVIIGAPHTSNWDFALMLAVVFIYRIEVRWMGKDSLFPFPIGYFMEWLGGISINRSKSNRVVGQIVDKYQSSNELRLIITPEGTRSKVEQWKSGFYHIAETAQGPILMGYVDFAKKEAGIYDSFQPTGDYEKDLGKIQAFYSTKTPKIPELF